MQIDEFENARPHLLALATRLLCSRTEAEDAVQETWLRADRADTSEVTNPRGWLTTVLSRVCLDVLRARRDTTPIEDVDLPATSPAPDEEAQLADAVGAALGAVVDALGPAERVAFVLHDVFAVPFDDVAAVLGKTPAATRQVASRARRRVAAVDTTATRAAEATAVSAFLHASREGDFAALVDLLDPDAVFRTYRDDAEPEVLLGAPAIAEAFRGRAQTAFRALLDGKLGYAVPLEGRVFVVTDIAFGPDGRIAALEATLRRAEMDAVDVVPV